MSTPLLVSYVLLWVLVAFQSLVIIGLVRSAYLLQHRVPVGGAGSTRDLPTPEFHATDLAGRLVSNETISGQKTALLFVSTKCRTCDVTLQDLEAVKAKANGNVIVVCQDRRNSCIEAAQKYGLTIPVIVDSDDELGQLFSVTNVPTAVLINEQGRIQSYGQPMQAEEVEEMLADGALAF
jgi:peroxiredoxin